MLGVDAAVTADVRAKSSGRHGVVHQSEAEGLHEWMGVSTGADGWPTRGGRDVVAFLRFFGSSFLPFLHASLPHHIIVKLGSSTFLIYAEQFHSSRSKRLPSIRRHNLSVGLQSNPIQSLTIHEKQRK